MIWLALAGFGVLGVWFRFSLAQLIGGPQTVWPTLLVNTIGSLGIGFIYIYLSGSNPVLRTGLMVGFFGALTTYSAFSLDTLRLIEKGSMSIAAGNVVLNNFLALVGCYVGVWIARHIAS